MGIFEWLFGKNEKRESTVPSITFAVRLETVEPPPVAYEDFTGELAGVPVRAAIPTKAKAECERLLRKPNRTDSENEYLHYNYWVNVYYKNERHSYHGINDIWTYSARDLPELPLLHDWIYSILGKKKPQINEDIATVKTWEEKEMIHALGSYTSIRVQVSFKPRGYVLAFLLKDDLRWEEKASYNTKTGQGDFPFYYSNAQGKIIEWGRAVFKEKKQQAKDIA
jgi:hypothetical protein